MAYYFFLGAKMPLPVTPGALKITTPSKNETVTLINDGEINILKQQGLREISFEFMLPQQKYPFANYTIADNYTASAYIGALILLKESKEPFQFIVTRMTPKGKVIFYTNITAQIEDFTLDEDADANGLDVMCSITLKEYKHYETKTVTITEATNGKKTATVTKPRADTKPTPKTVTVKKGDTLWNLCKKHLGDGSKYKEVAKLNKLANPNLIYPNQVLRLS